MDRRHAGRPPARRARLSGESPAPRFTIAPATGERDLDDVAALFDAYAASLPIDLAYQNFESERASLPGAYAPPDGALLLARANDGTPLGCVAMRRLSPGACEMKRMYVTPQARGLGAGLALARAIIDAGIDAGYREMKLDTLPSLTAAIALYEGLRFIRVPAYYDTPIAGTLFFARKLA